MARRFISLALIAALAACGGGSHSALPSAPSNQQSSPGSLKVTLKLGAPASSKAIARGRNYISYSTKGASIQFVAHGGTLNTGAIVAADVSLGSANCTTGVSPARTCTMTVPGLGAGLYDLQLSLWDSAPSNNVTPAGTLLSKSTSVTQAVVTGQNNIVNFSAIKGVVHDILLNLDHSKVSVQTPGTPVTANLSIVLKDPDGNVLVSDGTGDSIVGATNTGLTGSVSIADNDGTCGTPGAATKLNGATSTYTFTTIPTATIPVQYQGGCVVSSTLTAGVSGDTIAGTAGTAKLLVGGVTSEATIATMTAGGPNVIVTGPDGNIYMGAQNSGNSHWQILVISPSTGAVLNRYDTPNSGANAPEDMAVGSDGNIWFVEAGSNSQKFGYFKTDGSGAVGETAIPSSKWLQGITGGSDGALYITDGSNGSVYRATASTAGPSVTGPFYIIAAGAPGALTDRTGNGGTLLDSTTYTLYLTAVTAGGGETLVSAGVPVTTSAGTGVNNHDIQFTTPALPIGATSFTLYASQGAGAIYKQANVTLAGGTLYDLTAFASTTAAPPANTATSPEYLTNGPDGNLWIADQTANYAVLKMSAGASPSLLALNSVAPIADAPLHITTYDSTHVAYTFNGTSKIGIMSTAGAASSNPTTALPAGSLVVAADGNLYYGLATGGKIERMAPGGATAQFANGLGALESPTFVTTDVNGGNLWFGNVGSTVTAKFTLPCPGTLTSC